jgi:Na+/melibiose symporter-like transporter
MSSIGQLIGYAIGSIDMVSLFGTRFGDTQFKQMTVVAALSLIVAVLITSYSVRERVLISARLVETKLFVRAITDRCNPETRMAKPGQSRFFRNCSKRL